MATWTKKSTRYIPAATGARAAPQFGVRRQSGGCPTLYARPAAFLDRVGLGLTSDRISALIQPVGHHDYGQDHQEVDQLSPDAAYQPEEPQDYQDRCYRPEEIHSCPTSRCGSSGL